MTKNQMEKAYHEMPKNFMTPAIRKFDVVGTGENMRVVEIAKGTGIDDQEIWGVSEFKEDKDCKYKLASTGRGKMFLEKEEAHTYYLHLTY